MGLTEILPYSGLEVGVESTTYRERNVDGSRGVINAGEEVAATPGAGDGMHAWSMSVAKVGSLDE